MGSPESPIVRNLYMEDFARCALESATHHNAISVLVLLLPDIWVCLFYYNISCSVSETSVVLPSMNPPNIQSVPLLWLVLTKPPQQGF